MVEDARFTIHQELVARSSKPLKAMMQGKMKEALEGVATLEEVSEATFGRFVEYIYTGDYNPAAAVKAERVVEKETADAEVVKGDGDGEAVQALRDDEDDVHIDNDNDSLHSGDSDGMYGPRRIHPGPYRAFGSATIYADEQPSYGTSSPKHKTPTTDDDINPLKTSEIFPIPSSGMHSQATLPTAAGTLHVDITDRDFVPLFLSHAQIYAFAHLYDVPELLHRSAYCLNEHMNAFDGSPITDIAELIRYVYEHSPDRVDDKFDYLRGAVMKWVVNNIHALRQSASFRELLVRGGSFPDYLTFAMCLRLNSAAARLSCRNSYDDNDLV